MGFAKTVANRVIFMDEGEIIKENEPHQLSLMKLKTGFTQLKQ